MIVLSIIYYKRQYIIDKKQNIYYNHWVCKKVMKCEGTSMEDLQIANCLKLARIEIDLTQEQVAELAGVTRQTIGLIEAGKYNPSLKLCLILSKITGKGLDELFWIKGERDDQENY